MDDNEAFTLLASAEETVFGAIRDGDVDTVALYLASGGDVETTDSLTKQSLLVQATKYRDLAIVRLLLSQGADPNRYSYQRRESPPIDIGIGFDNLEMVEVFLKSGTNPTEMSLSRSRSVAMIDLLVRYGADVNSPRFKGRTPIFFVVENDEPKYPNKFRLHLERRERSRFSTALPPPTKPAKHNSITCPG